MIDVHNKKCIKCGDAIVTKKTNYLCYDCNPEKTKKQKEKENAVRDLLKQHGVNFIQDKAIKKNGCLKRPDFLIEFKNYYLIIEVDEYQHKDYDEEDEQHRMELIREALERPTKFIRYNPDNKQYNWRVKRKTLMEAVNKWINKEELENDEPIYLYYESI
jgi:Holliday junction resolvase-like predicted endonuclease